jgi:hypothetical protein
VTKVSSASPSLLTPGPHGGYPDAASYLLSDSMAGDVLVGLVLYPLVLSAVALLGAGIGRRFGASVTFVLR